MHKRPKLIGALVGVVTGAPQGIAVHEVAVPGFENALPVLLAFGLLAPPLLVGLNLLTRRARSHQWWERINEYFDFFHYMIWGCLSLALLGFYRVQTSSDIDPAASAVCVFFAAGGVGFLVASMVESKFGYSNPDAQQTAARDRVKKRGA